MVRCECTCWCGIGIDHALGLTGSLFVLLIHKDELGQVTVRLGQVKRLRLPLIVAAWTLRVKEVLFWSVEVVGV